MLHARAADTSVRARDVACRKVRVSAWRTRTAPIRIKAWVVWAEADRGSVVEVREVEAEQRGGGGKGVAGGGGGGEVVGVVVGVPVVAAVVVAGAEWVAAEAPEAAVVVPVAEAVKVV